MNKRFLSTLLFGALFIASTSVFVSCKDYDDDISNLQTQIDKAALKSELTALQTQLNNASTNAEAAMKNLEEKLAKQFAEQAAEQAASNADLQKQIDAVKAAAEAAAKDLAAKIEAAAKAAADAQAAADKAQQSADQAAKDAAEVAKAAKEAADQAVKEAVAKLNEQNAALAKQLEQLGKQMESYVTAEQLKAQIQELKDQIAHIDGAAEVTAAYRAAVDELYKAVTSVELINSFTSLYSFDYYQLNGEWFANYEYNLARQGFYLSYYADYIDIPLTHGTVPETSKFGDDELQYNVLEKVLGENAYPIVEYTKGNDVKDPNYGLLVRVNPVNADISGADTHIQLVNSYGKSLEDYVTVGTPIRFDRLLTRAKNIESGLWILPLEVSKGVKEDDFNNAVYDAAYGRPILHAVAINNTQETEADRYVVSSYDVAVTYEDYIPANHFSFLVANSLEVKSVEQIHNRYVGDVAWTNPIHGELWSFENANFELEWTGDPTATPIMKGAKQNVQNNNNLWGFPAAGSSIYYYYPYAMNDARWNESLFVVGLNETFQIGNIEAYTKYDDVVEIDSFYVVLDKINAVESEPSELNAWESYEIEGLNQTISAEKLLNLKVKSPKANGDVIGFRVFAVNRDGTLVDPDGRAFYVLVSDAPSNDSFSTRVTATHEGSTDTSEAINTKNKWNAAYNYELSMADVEQYIVYGKNADDLQPATLDYFRFNWAFNNDGSVKTYTDVATNSTITNTSLYGVTSYDLNIALNNKLDKLTITPTNIENLIDGATYIFKLTAYEWIAGTKVPRSVSTITLTKLMPTKAKELNFRPKQEVEDGSGKVIAYMIPNKVNAVKNAWAAPWTTVFAPHATVTEMEACYDASGSKADNGFKNLTNIFYDLSQNGQNGFDADPLVYNEDEWDKNFHFVFGTSDKDGKKDLVDNQGEGISWEHPGTAYDPLVPTTQGKVEKYMLDVHVNLIPNVNTIDEVIKDEKNWHAVKTSTVYKGISTKLKADGTVDCFNKSYPVANGQNFQFAYACWHHANSFAWKAASAQHKLKWSHEGKDNAKPFTDIVSKNTYDPAFFGDGTATSTSKTLKTLADKNFLIYQNCALYTEPEGQGQKNPYFVPSIAGTTITYKQKSTQTDAAPVADHTEYLRIMWKDAFNHDVVVELPVLIQRP